MPKLAVRKTIASALILAPLSCAQPESLDQHHSNRLGDIETRHWVHSNSLRGAMVALERKALSTWPQEVENEYAAKGAEADRQAFGNASMLARRLASSVTEIAAAVKTVSMSEADRRAFTAQTDTLQDQAKRLFVAAEDGNLDRMRADLETIQETCRACHERFREFTKSREILHEP